MPVELRRAAQAAVVLEHGDCLGRRMASLDGRTVLRLSLGPGAELPAHRIDERAWFLVLAGEARLEVDGESFQLGPEDSALVPAHGERAWRNPGTEALELLVLRGV
jgi:quercetin dioxygenase-like cupin family protein